MSWERFLQLIVLVHFFQNDFSLFKFVINMNTLERSHCSLLDVQESIIMQIKFHVGGRQKNVWNHLSSFC